jgi:hypothetical protein
MNFNNGTRPQPLAPEMRRMEQVIRDLDTGRLDTNTRYGRKQMWKLGESQRYLQVLLEGRTLTDPISIGRHVHGGRTREPAVNGNNRLRSIRKFVRNEIGVKAKEDGRVYTYYYSEIPDGVRGRNCRVLSPEVQNAFHDYPIPFNVRPNLTEQEEIAWYRELNTSLHAHTSGHLLVADICEVGDFATALLRHFPAVKERISEPESPDDDRSLGTFLIELSGCEPDFLHDEDKKENILLAHAGLLNLLANGSAYNGGWTGAYNEQTLGENIASMQRIFETPRFQDGMREEWTGPVNRQPYMQKFYHLNYLLGPIAWSLGTKKPDAVDTWIRFLESARPGTIQDVYLGEIAAENGVKDVKKFQFAWERVLSAMNA